MSRLSASGMHRKRRNRIIRRLIVATVGIASLSMVQHIQSHYIKHSLHQGLYTGQELIVDLVRGHPESMRACPGVTPDLFIHLINELECRGGLTATRYVSTAEQLAHFLYICRHASGTRATAYHFKRSLETINASFHKVVMVLSTSPLYTYWVRQPSITTPTSMRITKDTRFNVYFNNCIGAIDGTLIPAHVPFSEQERFRSRKGKLQFNVLATCTFDLFFSFVMAAFEGSAADSYVYAVALDTGRLKVPMGKWLLGDAGFGQSIDCMTPYRGVRYHLKEWQKASAINQNCVAVNMAIIDGRPENHEELYNLRHAGARNAIERIFGVAKRKWKVLVTGCEYSLDDQSRLVLSLCCLYSIIRTYDYEEPELMIYDNFPSDSAVFSGDFSHNDALVEEEVGRRKADRVLDHSAMTWEAARGRNKVAEDMWRDYQAVLRARQRTARQI